MGAGGVWLCRQRRDVGGPRGCLVGRGRVGKHVEPLPLNREDGIFARAGRTRPRGTVEQWVGAGGVQLQPLVDALKAEMLTHPVLHADETPVAMLRPGHGKTHRAYLWSYCTTAFDPMRAVVFDFADSRAGQHARDFLGFAEPPNRPGWRGKLVCDDFSGYKALFALGMTEVGCLAHARRKFHELWKNHQSTVAEAAWTRSR